MKINDWNGIQTDFDDLARQMDKSKVLINKEGTPKFFIKLLVRSLGHCSALLMHCSVAAFILCTDGALLTVRPYYAAYLRRWIWRISL